MEGKKDASSKASNPKMIKVGKYTITLNLLGSGQYGEVFLASDETGKVVAVKRIDISKKRSRKYYEILNAEIKLTCSLDNDHIVKFIDVIKTKNHLYLFLEYCDCESLQSFLENYRNIFNHKIRMKIIQFFAKEIAEGLFYLKKNKVLHRDVKLENIMISQKNEAIKGNFSSSLLKKKNIFRFLNLKESKGCINSFGEQKKETPTYYNEECMTNEKEFENEVLKHYLKIVDFGFAKFSEDIEEDISKSFIGTPLYIAPEVWKNRNKCLENYNYKVDIWSYGVCIYQLAYDSYPFNAKTKDDLYLKIREGKYIFNKRSELTLEFLDFIDGLLQNDPDKRYNYETILSHPFLTKEINEQTPYAFKEKVIKMDIYTKRKFLNYELPKDPEAYKKFEKSEASKRPQKKNNFSIFELMDVVVVESPLTIKEVEEEWILVNSNSSS